MKVLTLILAVIADIVPFGQAYVEPLQQRDSALVADQFEYGFRLDSLKPGTTIMLQDFSAIANDTLVLVRNWKIDTLRNSRGTMDIAGSVVIAPFEEGTYQLPGIAVRRTLPNGRTDTLLFDPGMLDVKTMPVDTATFEIHDLKGQMRYPLTFKEILPWICLVLLLAAMIWGIVWLVRRYRSRAGGHGKPDDPPHVVALRGLDGYRDPKNWEPERQKAYFSGVTDILKAYIDARFSVDAPEMTTAELFDALKSCKGISPELLGETKDMFELADFVKFAKHTATKEESRKSLSTAVNFVTSTYQTALEEEQNPNVL